MNPDLHGGVLMRELTITKLPGQPGNGKVEQLHNCIFSPAALTFYIAQQNAYLYGDVQALEHLSSQGWSAAEPQVSQEAPAESEKHRNTTQVLPTLSRA